MDKIKNDHGETELGFPKTGPGEVETGHIRKQEHAKFIIERFDHYYDGVNSKGTFYIGLNTFIFGGICVGYLSLYNKIDAGLGLWLLFFAVIICNSISMVLTVMAIMPFLKDNYDQNSKPSLVYFGGIAKHGLSYFKEKFHEADSNEMLDDLIQQAHCLAFGLGKKYKKLKSASHFVIAQFTLMIPLLYFIIKNLKP